MDPLSPHFSGAVRRAASQFLRELRHAAGFKTQAALASRLSVTPRVVVNAEAGQLPSVLALEVYVQACGSTLLELLSAVDAAIGLSSHRVQVATTAEEASAAPAAPDPAQPQ